MGNVPGRYHTKRCNSHRGPQYPCDCGNPKKPTIPKEWVERMAALEGDSEIGACSPELYAAMTDQDTTLKPCPFCGKPGMLEHVEGGRWSAGCSEHDSETECIGYISLTTYATKQEAIAAWNARTTDAEIERLTKELEGIACRATPGNFEDKPHQLFSALAILVERLHGPESRRAMDALYENIHAMQKAQADNERLRSALKKVDSILNAAGRVHSEQDRKFLIGRAKSESMQALTSTSASPVLAVVEAVRKKALSEAVQAAEVALDLGKNGHGIVAAIRAIAALDTGTGATQLSADDVRLFDKALADSVNIVDEGHLDGGATQEGKSDV